MRRRKLKLPIKAIVTIKKWCRLHHFKITHRSPYSISLYGSGFYQNNFAQYRISNHPDFSGNFKNRTPLATENGLLLNRILYDIENGEEIYSRGLAPRGR